jgi:hypothetical protein
LRGNFGLALIADGEQAGADERRFADAAVGGEGGGDEVVEDRREAGWDAEKRAQQGKALASRG